MTQSAADSGREAIVGHVPALRAYAFSLARDRTAADDLVQETVMKAWAGFHGFQPGSNLLAWLFVILRNSHYSTLRQSRRETHDPDGLHSLAMSVAPDHDGRLALRDFRRAFDTLPPEQRETLTLVGVLGLSNEAAARVMGIATGTVKSRLSRARARLAALLRLDWQDPEAGPVGRGRQAA